MNNHLSILITRIVAVIHRIAMLIHRKALTRSKASARIMTRRGCSLIGKHPPCRQSLTVRQNKHSLITILLIRIAPTLHNIGTNTALIRCLLCLASCFRRLFRLITFLGSATFLCLTHLARLFYTGNTRFLYCLPVSHLLFRLLNCTKAS